jgi:hypothetical protein
MTTEPARGPARHMPPRRMPLICRSFRSRRAADKCSLMASPTRRTRGETAVTMRRVQSHPENS